VDAAGLPVLGEGSEVVAEQLADFDEAGELGLEAVLELAHEDRPQLAELLAEWDDDRVLPDHLLGPPHLELLPALLLQPLQHVAGPVGLPQPGLREGLDSGRGDHPLEHLYDELPVLYGLKPGVCQLVEYCGESGLIVVVVVGGRADHD